MKYYYVIFCLAVFIASRNAEAFDDAFRTVKQYLQAEQAGDLGTCYELLEQRIKNSISKKNFIARVNSYPNNSEIISIDKVLSWRARSGGRELSYVQVSGENGAPASFLLVSEEGLWKVIFAGSSITTPLLLEYFYANHGYSK